MIKLILTIFLVLGNTFAHSAQTHVVYIGDSHSVGTFGEEMDAWIRNRAATDFLFFASGGTAPFQWLHGTAPVRCWLKDNDQNETAPGKGVCLAKDERPTENTPKFESLLKDSYPNKIAIIAHGTNFGTRGNSKQTPEQQFNEQVGSSMDLIKKASAHGYQCFWIGPPQMRKFEGNALETKYMIIQTAIKKAEEKYGAKCNLIDSRPLTQYPQSAKLDGIHYTFPGSATSESIKIAKEWAQKVIFQLP